ncbi:MAG: DegT/DnrJ/EryC1/StrS family aminotransferase [Desulfomonile tiedjei]|uniref:DegT/DnrJ/EryC1/StrS family aminotransferase n=1 Tax=Desulfomonile tiedjei TaxID=2358 RepID=A0A9D6Z5L5_9BACT|nr:DegT/DnrJ/EryC1/StrS family aminotransferase [Desulfomonile tiedjei]
MTQNDEYPKVPLLDLEPIHRPIQERLRSALLRVLESNRFIGGPEVENFEQEVAEYCRVGYAVGVSSGTDALIASLMALGLDRNDEVIVPSFTFFSTAGSVHRAGARPVFCDIDAETFNIDPTKLEALITHRTRGLIPVHLFGQCADMDPILEICAKRGLWIVEDAAQAIGAQYKGKMAGAFGDCGCFSFFPSKNLGGIGDGGMVITNSPEIAEEVRKLRDHGASQRYYHSVVGGNFRLDAVQAAALRVKLSALEQWHEQRIANARAYCEAFSDLQEKGLLKIPGQSAGCRHVFNQFVIRVPDRDGLQEHLAARGVGTAIYYPIPLHLQRCFDGYGYHEGSLPESEKAAREVLALPVFPGLVEAQRDKVIRHIREFLL